MATFLSNSKIQEQKAAKDSLFEYEKKFHSPMARFIDKTPTFVTFFQIADDLSTVDEGFNHVDDFLGNTSPLRYKKIENFPIYGLDQMVLQIEDSEHGLDRSYEGEGTIINSTIVPLQNSMFMIPSLHDFYIFRIISVSSDNIMTDNYYQIQFRLEYVDREKATWLNRQTVESYACLLENIGTDKKCIIRSDELEQIHKLEAMYDDIVDTYKSIFYSSRYNDFIGEIDGPCHLLYDPFQVEFMNRHNLLNRKNQLMVIIPTQQFNDPKRALKYERSVYRFFERRDLHLLSNFKFNTFPGVNNTETAFAKYADETVQIVDIPSAKYLNDTAMGVFGDEFVNQMKLGLPAETKYGQLLIDYIRKDGFGLSNIPLDLMDELLQLDGGMEIFLITPIILYIIKSTIESTVYREKDLTSVEV